MDNTQELLKQAQKLDEKKKYQEVVDLLTDEVLEKHKNADLYAERAQANWRLKNNDACFNDAEKAIGLDSKCAKAYCYRGNFWLNNKQHDKALSDYNKAIELDPNFSYPYNGRGNIWQDKKELDKALSDYNKAIELDPNFSYPYNGRGNTWQDKKELDKALSDYNKAIELDPRAIQAYNGRANVWLSNKELDKALSDYNKAIELDPDFTYAYYNRGLLWVNKKNYNKALSDYNKAIELDPNFSYPYNGRGSVWRKKSEFAKAIANYDKAIELDPEFSYAYYNRGLLWIDEKNYEKAVNDFEQALKLEPKLERAEYWLDHAKAMLGEKVETEENPTEPRELFRNALEDLDKNDRTNIYSKADDIMRSSFAEIRKHSCDGIKGNVVHYTKLKVGDILTSNPDAKLRYYNAVYMNDPEEGRLILDCLDDNIKDAFKAGQREEESNIYLGSFLPAEFSDDLILWRTYGKDENNIEATGCNIEIDSKFFDTDRELIHIGMRSTNNNSSDIDLIDAKHTLYKVLYYDKRKKQFVGKDHKKIEYAFEKFEKELTELLDLKDNKKEPTPKDIAINKIVYHIISELRYFVKSSDYSFEKELRVIQLASSSDNRVQFDESSEPPRLFIESKNPILKSLRKITLGPKVSHPEQWIYLEARVRKNGGRVKLQPSEVKFQ